MVVVANQQKVQGRGVHLHVSRSHTEVPKDLITLVILQFLGLSTRTNKAIQDEILEGIMKGLKDLRVEVIELKNDQKPNTS